MTNATVSITPEDLIALITAAGKHRRVLREQSRSANAEGDIKSRNRLGKEYHQLSETLRHMTNLYVESL